ncbi:MAG: S24 family peptidase [Phycisphaeraceae bacterium]
MQTVGQIVRDRRERLGLTLAALAAQIGSTKSYLSMIENHRVANPPSDSLLVALERALGVTGGELIRAAAWQNLPGAVKQDLVEVTDAARQGRELARWLKAATSRRSDGAKNLDELHRTGKLARKVNALLGETATTPKGKRGAKQAGDIVATIGVRQQAPLINRVSAGYPRDFTDLDYPRQIADEYVAAPGVTDPDAFAARVVGDSMLPEYKEGDIVVFSPAATVSDGSDCFVRLEPDHETTFKRVFFEVPVKKSAEQGVRLQPLNPKYPPRVLPRSEVSGLYRAVWRFSPLM